MQNSNSTIKVTDPQRILRIFKKISDTRLPIFMRPSMQSTLAIKGRASEISRFHRSERGNLWQLAITGVSDKGVSLLREKKGIILEFVLTASKLVCKCSIQEVKSNYISIKLPNALLSLERRSTARYKTLSRAMAYVKLSTWNPDERDFLAPPVFDHHGTLANFLPVNDISIGGLSIKTYFPSTSLLIRKDSLDLDTKLYLPLQKPISVPLKFLWVKKVSEAVEVKPGKDAKQMMWLFGSSFVKIEEAQLNHIKKFIQKTTEVRADESLDAIDLPQPSPLLTKSLHTGQNSLK